MAIEKKIASPTIILFLLALVAAFMLVPAAALADEQLTIKMNKMYIHEVDGMLEVTEVYYLENSGDEPIVADTSLPEEEQYTFKASIPTYYSEIGFLEGIKDPDSQVTVVDKEIRMNIELKPGETELVFAYSVLPHNGPQYIIDKQVFHPTEMMLLLTRGDIGLSAPKVSYLRSSPWGSDTVNEFYLEEPVVGEKIMLLAGTNIPIEGREISNQNALERGYRASFHADSKIRFWYSSPFGGIEPHLFMFIFSTVTIAGTVFYVKSRNRELEELEEDKNEEKFQKLLEQQKELMEKLAKVEKMYRAEEINKEEYDKLYQTYKEKLTKVKVQLKLLSD